MMSRSTCTLMMQRGLCGSCSPYISYQVPGLILFNENSEACNQNNTVNKLIIGFLCIFCTLNPINEGYYVKMRDYYFNVHVT